MSEQDTRTRTHAHVLFQVKSRIILRHLSDIKYREGAELKRGFTKKSENTKEAWKLKVTMELQSFADISSYPHEIHIQPLRCLLRLCRASGNGGTVRVNKAASLLLKHTLKV